MTPKPPEFKHKRLFHQAHYNIIAAQIKNLFPIDDPDVRFSIGDYVGIKVENMKYRAILCQLAVNLAKRFLEDNPDFDPLKFLDACSPNTDLYPLSELWERTNA